MTPKPTHNDNVTSHLLWTEDTDGNRVRAHYDQKLPIWGAHRRILGFVTDEVDDHRIGPRNTLFSIAAGVAADPHTNVFTEPEVHRHLADLVRMELLDYDEDTQTYHLTDAGWVELVN